MSTHITRTLLNASLALTPPRHAWPIPQSLRTIGQPRQWIEPLIDRDHALAEARDIAEHNPFGVGFAWCHLGKWYAADFKPGGHVDGYQFTEILTVEIGKASPPAEYSRAGGEEG